MSLTFEWDGKKADTNLAKHGVAFAEATSIFGDDRSSTIPDPDHSFDEDRFVTIGRSTTGNVLAVVHTVRGANFRIISARKANTKERIKYEEKNK